MKSGLRLENGEQTRALSACSSTQVASALAAGSTTAAATTARPAARMVVQRAGELSELIMWSSGSGMSIHQGHRSRGHRNLLCRGLTSADGFDHSDGTDEGARPVQ